MSKKGDGEWTRGPGVQLREDKDAEGEKRGVASFNMHSPGEGEQAALSAGAPV